MDMNMNKGKIVKVTGQVVDVEFPEGRPGIYNALTVEYKVQNQPAKVTLEVQQHLGDKLVRAISMAAYPCLPELASAHAKETIFTTICPRPESLIRRILVSPKSRWYTAR